MKSTSFIRQLQLILLLMVTVFVAVMMYGWHQPRQTFDIASTRSSERMRLLADMPSNLCIDQDSIRDSLGRKFPIGTKKSYILANLNENQVGKNGFFCYQSKYGPQEQLDCSLWAEPRYDNEPYWHFSFLFDPTQELQDIRVEIAGVPSL